VAAQRCILSSELARALGGEFTAGVSLA